jgi:leader peptidase (prepilin peptidase)/N-methyltransferase
MPAVPLLAAVFGLFVGSFLNVVAYRLHTKEQFLRGRSRCPHCGHELSVADLVPLFSFLALRGRCRYCRAPISLQYLLVELATGLAFGLAVWRFGPGAEAFAACAASAFLIIIFVYDLRHHLILDAVSAPFAGVALLSGLVFGRGLLSLLAGAAIGAGVFLVQILLSRGAWVGWGDAKLGAGMGLLLGWNLVLVALFLAYAIGAVFSAGLLLARRATAKTQIAFGTFLTLGTFLALLWGDALVNFTDRLV